VSADGLCYTGPVSASIFKAKIEALKYSEMSVYTSIDQLIVSHPGRMEPSATASYSLKATLAEILRYNLPLQLDLTYWDYGSVVEFCDSC
jgi:hypothetical protein